MVNFWKRSMSMTPTAGSAAPNRSGRWFSTAPISRPPLLPPEIASFFGEVYLLAINHSAAAMKSSNTFCFFSFMPVEGDVGFAKDRVRARFHVGAENRSRNGETGEGIKRFGVGPFAGETSSRTDAG